MTQFYSEATALQPNAASVTIAAPGANRILAAMNIRVLVQRVGGNAAMTAVLRNGAAGVGPVIRTFLLAGATSIPTDIVLTGQFILASANTPLTLEFTGGNAAYNTFVAVGGVVL